MTLRSQGMWAKNAGPEVRNARVLHYSTCDLNEVSIGRECVNDSIEGATVNVSAEDARRKNLLCSSLL